MISKISCLIILGIILNSSMQNTGCTYSKSHKSIDTTKLDDQDKAILRVWRKDSLGCLGKRDTEDGYYLLNKLGLLGASRSQVEEVFGLPNEVMRGDVAVDDTDFDNAFRLFYYCYSICSANRDTIHNESWIEIVIPATSDSVVAIYSGIY